MSRNGGREPPGYSQTFGTDHKAPTLPMESPRITRTAHGESLYHPAESLSSSPSGSSSDPSSCPQRPRRRLSMDEDFFYQNVMSQQCRPSHPPSYNASTLQQTTDEPSQSLRRRHSIGPGRGSTDNDADPLPTYTNPLILEGVFCRKHEIENTTKRAEDRRWHNSYVVLNGTALHIYNVKKDWGWGRSRDGPSICPDNPPWVKKAKLEKSYSLLHADAGIAADYKKRRYVIRIRAETDQFLLSCIELSTFVKWLQGLFAAIDIAAPIDDRDFPRDMSIPRVQRVRWYRGLEPTRARSRSPTALLPGDDETAESSSVHRRESDANSQLEEAPDVDEHAISEEEIERMPTHDSSDSDTEDDQDPASRGLGPRLTHRLSNTSYHNVSINPHSGKWFPDHRWTEAHDMLYAKLCFNNLLFRSPRKSNYIISKGKQWFVDWSTGKMVRVLPPAYGEVDYFGPWQVIHTENMRI